MTATRRPRAGGSRVRSPDRRPRPGPRLGPRARRVLAALLAALSIGGLGQLALSRPSTDEVRVLVATREVPVGAPVASALEPRMLPAAAVPEAALREAAGLEDAVAASVLTPGEVVTAADTRVPGLLAGQPEGTVAAFLPVGDPAVLSALHAGDRVDVHSPLDGSSVLTEVLVLGAVPGEQGGAWLAVSPGQAGDLAAARGADPVSGALLVSLRAHPEGWHAHPEG